MELNSVVPFTLPAEGQNVANKWESWIRSLKLYLEAADVQEPKRKTAVLLHCAGAELQEIYFTLKNNEQSSVSSSMNITSNSTFDEFEETVRILTEYFKPRKSTVFERFKFRQMIQSKNESIDQFVTRLKSQGAKCEFSNVEENIRDQLIDKCNSGGLRSKMLEKQEATLKEILDIARAMECVDLQKRHIEGDHGDDNVCALKNGKNNTRTLRCFNCGIMGHYARSDMCKARGKKCNICGKIGHFSQTCRSKNFSSGVMNRTNNMHQQNSHQHNPSYEKSKQVNQMQFNGYDFTFKVNDEATDGCMRINVAVGGVHKLFLIDSGSTCNVIDKNTWEELKQQGVQVFYTQKRDNRVIQSYANNEPLVVIGEFGAEFRIGDRAINGEVIVIEGKGIPILGKLTAEKLGVLKVGLHVNALSNKKIGKIKGIQVSIPIDVSVAPIAQPYRRVPIPILEKVNTKLDELIEDDIIEQVDAVNADWISPLVIIPKENGDIRMCVDMRRANEAIKPESFPIPTLEDLLSTVDGSTIFSKLDIRSAFHQVEIEASSRHITTFVTHRGLYAFKRLWFGLNCASEKFQRIMMHILSNCEGCIVYIDDIMIHGKTNEEHDRRLKKVLSTLKERGVTLNDDKCNLNCKQIEFLGHVISASGISPKVSRVNSIKLFRRPETKEEVRSFIGLTNYVGRFIPHFSSISAPLRELICIDKEFEWTDRHEKSFQDLKDAITSDTVLGYYNVNDKIQIIADAGPKGLGAVLVQIGENGPRIISFASRSLTKAEQNYCQLEKEALALVWAVERFKLYVFGREFDLITDSKPLEFLFGPRAKTNARIERWIMQIQSYRYKVVHIHGKANIADPLSRLPVHNENENCANFIEVDTKGTEDYICRVIELAVPSAMTLTEIENESKSDIELIAVRRAILSGNWDIELKPYEHFRDELCVKNDIIIRGNKIVMPSCLRLKAMQIAHESHAGMTVMKRRLRSKVWWPQVDRDVENYVKNCRSCILVGVQDPPEEMNRKKLPSAPWEDICVDFLGPLPSGDYIMLAVDYYSRYIAAEILQSITTVNTTFCLTKIFAQFGIPNTLTSDNGPNLRSVDFKKFCGKFGINNFYTTPFWPQANGEVERQNRTLLKILKIAQLEGKDWKRQMFDFLWMYHATPHSTTGKSPGELMFKRRLRDKIPDLNAEECYGGDDQEFCDMDKINKSKSKEKEDLRRHARASEIKEGDMVYVKQQKKNKLSSNFCGQKAKVLSKIGNSVIIQQGNKIYKRNTTHLKLAENSGKFNYSNYKVDNPVADLNVPLNNVGISMARLKFKICKSTEISDDISEISEISNAETVVELGENNNETVAHLGESNNNKHDENKDGQILNGDNLLVSSTQENIIVNVSDKDVVLLDKEKTKRQKQKPEYLKNYVLDISFNSDDEYESFNSDNE